MLQWLYENPVAIAVIGLALCGLAVFVWLQNGSKGALGTAAGLLLLTLVTVIVSVRVVTPTERIRQILDEVAAALERNDRETVYSYIHPNAEQAVQRAKSELPRYEFSTARVTRIKSILVNQNSSPPTAIAEFNVRVDLTIDGGQKYPIPRFVKVYFMLHDGDWRVRDYEHAEASAGFRQNAL